VTSSFDLTARGRPFLVLTDFSPASRDAVQRAGLLAAQQGVGLRLMHAVGAGEREQARGQAQAHLQAAAEAVRDCFGVAADTLLVQGDALPHALAQSRDAGCLVIGGRRANALREMLLGTPAERLVRLSRVPVLVVKGAGGHAYRRVLVPVDIGRRAEHTLRTALAVEVFHAYGREQEVSARAGEVPEAARRQTLLRSAAAARAWLRELIPVHAGHCRPMVVQSVGRPAEAALQRESALCANLMVVGKHGRGRLASYFVGSFAQRMLQGSRCDLLVVPDAPDEGHPPLAQGAPQDALAQ
jgi:nucleotide-binding universal stress UspA family protein